MSTLYPVCIANAHDCMPADKVLAVSGHLLLISGIGSVAGPIIGTSVMTSFGIDGLFYFMAAVTVILALVAAVSSMVRAAPQQLQRPFEILTPQAVSLAHDPLGSPCGEVVD